MQIYDQVQRVGHPDAAGTVIAIRESGGHVFVRVSWNANPHGYHPWYAIRQLEVIAPARAPEN